jgi:Protein of unknown function (DUF3465)
MFPVVCLLGLFASGISMDEPRITSPQLIPKLVFVHQVEEIGVVVKGSPSSGYRLTNPAVLENAYNAGISNLQVMVQGQVTSVLSDDLYGDRHQRFILQLSNGQTLLIAHNIDLAPRVDGLRSGDTVIVFGEYEWNAQGGTIHWTHHDPDGSHVGGWIDHNGLRYQ